MTKARDYAAGRLVAASINGGNRGDVVNLLMNSRYVVNQRGNTAVSSDVGYCADQWFLGTNVGNVSLERVTDAAVSPSDYTNLFLQLRTNTAGSLAANTYAALFQRVEGYRQAVLRYGTSQAKASVLSFRASASAACVMSVAIRNGTTDRSIVFPVSVGTVPQQYTLIVPGDTGGSWAYDNSWASLVTFAHTCGSSYQTATQGAWLAGNYLAHTSQTNGISIGGLTLRISDAQWEVGGIKTPLQQLDHLVELTALQRYCEVGEYGMLLSATAAGQYSMFIHNYRVPKRATPNLTRDVAYANNVSGVTFPFTNSDLGFSMHCTATGAGVVDLRGRWVASA